MTAKGMKKGLTSYGDADFSLFLRKAFVKAMGLSDDALARPIVGIANTFSDYNACHGNVPQLVDAIKRGVMLAGGLPMEFPTISIHESFAYPTSIGPTGTKTAGRSADAAAIICAGIVLSQPPIRTTASSGSALSISSVSIASRLRSSRLLGNANDS